jgi:hypothetical protein
MSNILPVGIPLLVILGLVAIVVYERHTERVEERRRTENLKRWLHSQGPPG